MPRRKKEEAEIVKLSLEDRAEQIKKLAEDRDLEDNYYFLTTFERYETQLKVLKMLKDEIDNLKSAFVTKKYVRGSSNTYAHPAIKEYNHTSESANRTCALLLKILSGNSRSKEDDDPLMQIINGRKRK